MKKYFYCECCQKYPDTIYEEKTATTKRKWDGECYQGYETEFREQDGRYFCGDCGEEVKEEEIKKKIYDIQGRELTDERINKTG